MVGTLTERNDSGGYSGEGEHLFRSESEQQSERSDAGMMIDDRAKNGRLRASKMLRSTILGAPSSSLMTSFHRTSCVKCRLPKAAKGLHFFSSLSLLRRAFVRQPLEGRL